ncbi:hypothetical protein Trydic_g8560 [Trypoxylus dichotomus]
MRRPIRRPSQHCDSELLGYENLLGENAFYDREILLEAALKFRRTRPYDPNPFNAMQPFYSSREQTASESEFETKNVVPRR